MSISITSRSTRGDAGVPPRRLGRPARTTGQLVIGHRGASGHRPEHTAAAYRLALRLGADSVEPDLVPTRDGVLVCRHDVELSRTTDVAQHPEFGSRRTTMQLGTRAVTGWFVHDFTLAELRTLRARERWPEKRPGSAAYDGWFPVLAFDELLELVAHESDRAGVGLQVHAELKHPEFFARQGLPLADLVGVADRPGVTWMSFDPEVLQTLAGRGAGRLVRLHLDKPRGRELSRTAEWASGVGVRRKVVLPRRETLRPSGFVTKAADRGLDVLVWSHRPENTHLPRALRRGSDPYAHGDARREAELLWRAGVAGIVSDVPEVAVAARDRQPMLRAG